MPLVSTITKTLQVKIVYYGPGLSGKTTNLEQLNKILSKDRAGELMSLDTKGDRTLFFDWMPLDLGKIRGFDVRVQLYTVPGQVRYNKTRQQVLRGADGIVFVADSQKAASEQNVYSLGNLRDNMSEMGIDIEDIPMVIQCNKRDLPETMSTRDLAILLRAEHLPFIEAVAHQGKGVMETLRLITRLTMKNIQKYLSPSRLINLKEEKDASLDGDSLLEKIMANKEVSQEMAEAEKEDQEKLRSESSQLADNETIAPSPESPVVHSEEEDFDVEYESREVTPVPEKTPPEENSALSPGDEVTPQPEVSQTTPPQMTIEAEPSDEEENLSVRTSEFSRTEITPVPENSKSGEIVMKNIEDVQIASVDKTEGNSDELSIRVKALELENEQLQREISSLKSEISSLSNSMSKVGRLMIELGNHLMG
ncbi:MAG: hypothetical protein JXR95_01735 [Deltaproteobacteria bacterium]|nr:hypothetical protein [Deltaproteobacteria bacterium]